jgi:O-antigen/teichoic acid export membrane protein
MTTEAEIEELTAEERDEAQFNSPASLESRALKGTYYVVGFYGLALAIRFGSSIALTRLYVPSMFGLMTLITTVIVGLTLFTHIGLEDSVIANPRGDEEEFINTAWTIQVLRGIGVWLVTVLLAWPVAHFYGQPSLLLLLPVVGFGCVIGGFSSPKLLVLSRNLGVGRSSLMELISQIVLFGVSYLWALSWPTVWALAIGRIISELVRTACTYWLIPGKLKPRFILDKKSIQDLVHFGRWILIGTVLTYLANQSDRLILPKLFPGQTGLAVLGIYGIAFSLSDLPRQIIQMFSSKVGFPFIAKFVHYPRPEFRLVILKYRRLVLATGAVLLTGTVCVGDIFILHAYPPIYHDAAWMIAIFGLGLWHTLLYNTITPAIFSLQKAHYNALGYLFYCIVLFTLLPIGFHAFGLAGAVAAVAISDLPMYFVNVYASQKQGLGMLRQDAYMTLFFLVTLASGFGIRHVFGFGLPFPGIH